MQCAPQANFSYGLLMPMSSCANVSSLVSLAQIFANSEDPTFKNLYPSGTCCLRHSSLGTPPDFVPLWWPSAHKVWIGSVHLFARQPEKNKKRYKFLARAQHVQCAPQTNFLYGVLMSLSSCDNAPNLVSLAKKFANSEDPTFKNLYPSCACRLCRSSLGTVPDFVFLW